MSTSANDWINALDTECKRSTQQAAAKLLGYSAAVVNQILKGTYKGDLSSVEASVRGALMGAKVQCPVIGEIPRNRCVEHQRRAGNFAATNPTRVQLSITCPTCSNNDRRNK